MAFFEAPEPSRLQPISPPTRSASRSRCRRCPPVRAAAWGDIDFMGWRHGVDASGRVPDDLLRFGVDFADGGRATSLDILARRERTDEPPAGPVLWRLGGGGGGLWSHDIWVWPLPPPG